VIGTVLVGRGRAVLREAWAMGWSSPVTAVVTVLTVAAMCLTVLLTQGRAVGARDAVVATLDDAGSRTITVRAEPGAGLTTEVLTRLAQLDGVGWFGAFGQATDVVSHPGGTKIPVRPWLGGSRHAITLPDRTPDPGRDAFASPTAIDQLGLVDGYGAVASADEASYPVVGTFTPPAQLHAFEPLLLVPATNATQPQEVSLLVVVAHSAAQVAPVASAVQGVVATEGTTGITVSTSEQIAGLQTSVDRQLSGFTTVLVAGVLVLAAVLVAALQLGTVLLRRRDFGRRRALGASQTLVATLLLVQTGLLAAIGAAIGTAAALTALAASGDPLAPPGYIGAVATLALVTAVVGALPPAIIAAHRDPLHELRVP
jgi:putative ABC transport system permease protein